MIGSFVSLNTSTIVSLNSAQWRLKTTLAFISMLTQPNGFLYKKAPNEESGRIVIVLFFTLKRTRKRIFLFISRIGHNLTKFTIRF